MGEQISQQNENKFIVYGLYDGDDLRYIGLTGKSIEWRLSEHLKERRGNSHRKHWIAAMMEAGKEITAKSLAVGLTRSEAVELEIKYIAEFRAIGCRLVNGTNGGDGVSGFKMNAEQIAAVRMRMKGESNPFFGKKHTPEVMERIASKIRGRPSPLRGKSFTAEHRQRISTARLGLKTWNAGNTKFNLNLIRELSSQGRTQTELANLFEMNQGTVSKIVNFKKSYMTEDK